MDGHQLGRAGSGLRGQPGGQRRGRGRLLARRDGTVGAPGRTGEPQRQRLRRARRRDAVLRGLRRSGGIRYLPDRAAIPLMGVSESRAVVLEGIFLLDSTPGLRVDDSDDDDPVLVRPDGSRVDTWREHYPYPERLARQDYDHLKRLLQIELVKLQYWIK